MSSITPAFRWLSKLPFVTCCIGLSWCIAPDSGASSGAPGTARGISEISIERDCFGCASGSRMVMRSDGSALMTEVGKARLGTEDKLLRGRVESAEFNALADLLFQRGFFQMQAIYDDPALQDGAWITVRATRDGQEKEVFAREPSTPPDLRAVETAIQAIQQRITFKP